MIISAKIILIPHRSRICAVCGCGIYAAQVRLYGMAEQGDPPYALRVHPECTPREAFEKLKRANHGVQPTADHAAVLSQIEWAVNQVGSGG